MVQNPIDPTSGGAPQGAGRVDPASLRPSRKAQPGRETGPAFEALLEKLERQAAELKQTSETELDPEHLSGAVDRARASLEDALGLGDRLLEAYRQATHQAAPKNRPDEAARGGDDGTPATRTEPKR